MTVQPMDPTQGMIPGQALEVPSYNGGSSGLDDMDAGDLSVPRLSIVGNEGVFKDSLSGQKYPEIDVIILGLVKQRSLWHGNVTPGEESKPMCRSNDFMTGFPQMKPVSLEKSFPWQRAGLGQEHLIPREDGQWAVACASCALKDWGSAPDEKKPYCSEVWSMPLLMDPFQNGQWMPFVLSVQKSNISPTKKYLGGYKAANSATFTMITHIKLNMAKSGQVTFSNTEYSMTERTESSQWQAYEGMYVEMRNFLIQAPRVFNDAPTVPAQQVQAQPQHATPAIQQPQQQSQPPVYQPTPQYQQQQEQYAPQAQQAPPVQPPVQQASPVQPQWDGQTQVIQGHVVTEPEWTQQAPPAQQDAWLQQTEQHQPPEPTPPPVQQAPPVAAAPPVAPPAAPPAMPTPPPAPPAPPIQPPAVPVAQSGPPTPPVDPSMAPQPPAASVAPPAPQQPPVQQPPVQQPPVQQPPMQQPPVQQVNTSPAVPAAPVASNPAPIGDDELPF